MALKEKNFIDVSVSLSPIEEEGSITGISIMARDIGKLRRLERRFQLIVNSALDAVIVMNGQGIITEWNPQAESSFGWSREEAIGKPLADCIIPERYRSAHWNGLRHFLETGEGPIVNRRIEVNALRRNGEEFPVELTVLPLTTHGEYEFSAFVRDIAEEKKNRHELQFRNEEMEQLLYTVSHDLKSPLITLQGFAGMLPNYLRMGKTEDAQNAAERIKRAASTMGALINDILQLGKLGREEITITMVSVDDVLNEVIENLGSLTGRRAAELKLQFPFPVIHTDRARLYQVFQNLLSNALKYGCPMTGCTVTVGWQQADLETLFFVKDEGAGIPEEYHEMIFHIFRRLDRSQEGTGIGLAIVARILRLLGGRIWLESPAGGGAIFWFSIPHYHPRAQETVLQKIEKEKYREK